MILLQTKRSMIENKKMIENKAEHERKIKDVFFGFVLDTNLT
jgi:hypothetical protein